MRAKAVTSDATRLLGGRFKIEIMVYDRCDEARHDPGGKAEMSSSYRPVMHVE